jgi:hypothetical protein
MILHYLAFVQKLHILSIIPGVQAQIGAVLHNKIKARIGLLFRELHIGHFCTCMCRVKTHQNSRETHHTKGTSFSLKRRLFLTTSALYQSILLLLKLVYFVPGLEIHQSKILVVVYSGEVRQVQHDLPSCCKIAHRDYVRNKNDQHM